MKEKIGAAAISVKSPCSEKWDEMFGDEKTRACSHCEKNVNDISMLTEDEAWKLIDDANGNLCVRYEAHPVTNAPIFADKFYQITKQTGVAAGVLGATLAVSASGYAQESTSKNLPQTQVTITKNNQTKKSPTKTTKSPKAAPTPPPPLLPKIMGKIAIRRMPTNPLIVAVQQGKTLKVRLMVAKGADVNEKDLGFYSRTALHLAVEENNLKMARILLNAGADVDSEDSNKQTPLMILNGQSPGEIIRLLANHEANLNVKNWIGQTPLMRAAMYQNFEAVKALLEFGADAKIKDNYGNSALDSAQTEDIKQILIAYGAEQNAKK